MQLGASTEANYLSEQFDKISDYLNESAVGSSEEIILQHIETMVRDSKNADCDEEIVDHNAAEVARDLIGKLPIKATPPPIVGVDNRGGVILDWENENNDIFTIICYQKKIIFSGNFRTRDNVRGDFPFNAEPPTVVINSILRISKKF